MSVFLSMIKKETLHIVRDARTMIISIFMPMVLLLLFGFAISMEVNDVRIVAVVDEYTDQTRDLLERFATNEYFTFRGLATPEEVERLLRDGEADAAVFLRQDHGKLESQIVVDASYTTIAQSTTTYIQGVIDGNDRKGNFLMQTLYNPRLKSAYNFVPGIMGMIFILICAIMTSVSIVSEKESGTMDLLLVSPVKPSTIIFGKLIPYFLLSCVILSIMLALAYTVLGLPPSPNIASVIFVSLIYVALSLAIGLLVSSFVSNQMAALTVSAAGFMLPVVMLSGMIYPIDNMPQVLQWVSTVIPARWYISAMKKLMIQQLPIEYVWTEIGILTGVMALILTVAIHKFAKR